MKPRRLSLLLLGATIAFGRNLDVGTRKQLFIDDRFVENAVGIERHVNPPVKCGPILTGGAASWDNGLVAAAVTVLEDAGKFRLWYTACPASGRALAPFKLGYAESDDGIHWVKPNLGFCEWEGSKANNIIMESNIENGGGVFLDPTAPTDQRYKLLARLSAIKVLAPDRDPQINNAPHGSGLYLYTSPDGLRWKLQPTRVFPFSPDTVNIAFYDGRTGTYLAYVRTWNPLRRVGVVEMKDILQPWPYAKVAPRLWPGRTEDNPAPSREVPEAFGPGPNDPADVDFYTSAVVKYPWADDAYFMFPSAYRHFPEPPAGKLRNDGLLDIELAVSRDGHHFHRVSRFPYIELGLKGSGESGSMYMGVGMIRRGTEIYQYYGGYDHSHAGYLELAEVRNQGSLRLVRQRLDGLVSIDAAQDGGQFETPGIRFEGRRLTVNLDASATGEVWVELRELDGRPVAGYSFADSDALGGNEVAAVATWRRGHDDVGPLSGRPVRLAFKMRTAKLYAFQFEN